VRAMSSSARTGVVASYAPDAVKRQLLGEIAAYVQ